MADDDSLIRALTFQATACAAMGSPFSGALLGAAAADVASGGPSRGLFAPWAGAKARALVADAVPLRLLGALHDLALGEEAPALTDAYPSAERPGDPAPAWTAALEAMADRKTSLAAFMAHEPQTNEVRRSACLLGGFLRIADRTALPLRCFELGASAGLNQIWDRYGYTLAAAGRWGDAGAPVVIDTEWRGPPPALEARVSIVERAACDRKPIDLSDPKARRRLRAYVWPDQFDRLQRLDDAIAAARAAGVRVEAEDAVTWAARRGAPREGFTTVLFHS
ncbi:MAG: DUF2332 domain-containing protein, partial [Caulobacteraceae bacterium]